MQSIGPVRSDFGKEDGIENKAPDQCLWQVRQGELFCEFA
jgi:hypothetical protein